MSYWSNVFVYTDTKGSWSFMLITTGKGHFVPKIFAELLRSACYKESTSIAALVKLFFASLLSFDVLKRRLSYLKPRISFSFYCFSRMWSRSTVETFFKVRTAVGKPDNNIGKHVSHSQARKLLKTRWLYFVLSLCFRPLSSFQRFFQAMQPTIRKQNPQVVPLYFIHLSFAQPYI